MTALPEAKLAREAEICYATLACITDYDTWHETEESVTIEIALANLARSADIAKKIINIAAARIPEGRECGCTEALKNAIITDPEKIPERMKKELDLLIGKYIR